MLSGLKRVILCLLLLLRVERGVSRCRKAFRDTYICKLHNLENTTATTVFAFGGNLTGATRIWVKLTNTKSLRFVAGKHSKLLTAMFFFGVGVSPLETFDFDQLPLAIEILYVHGHQLKKLLNVWYLERMTNLVELDLSDNKLGDFDFSRLPSSVRRLDLSDNKLANVNVTVLFNKVFKENKWEILKLTSTGVRDAINCDHLCAEFRDVLWFFDQFLIHDCAYIECFFCHALQCQPFSSRVLLDGSNYFWSVFKSSSCVLNRV